jgi:hypothetical protein
MWYDIFKISNHKKVFAQARLAHPKYPDSQDAYAPQKNCWQVRQSFLIQVPP